jgi:tRNA-specific 2-thiouridylase
MAQKETVFVGLSGGVDSSVAALRLLRAGYSVVGVFIKVWHPDFLVCNWEQERLDAMRVAAKLGIPFLTCDAEKAYKDDVADYFIREYEAGRTPNPDVMCNKYVKFGAFLDFAKKHGATYIATGHYAQVEKVGEEYRLLRGADANKDQSYFLWTLSQAQLSHTLFPVGDSAKDEIRKEAARAGLLTAGKRDSQGICFLGHVDIPEFLSHYMMLEEGDVLSEDGRVIGRHEGALVYTSGQRHGFTITDPDEAKRPHYILSRDIANNTITVSEHKPQERSGDTITLVNFNAIAWMPREGEQVELQTRYRQKPVAGTITAHEGDTLTITYAGEGEQASEGQSCVLYRGSRCLGGGIIA